MVNKNEVNSQNLKTNIFGTYCTLLKTIQSYFVNWISKNDEKKIFKVTK